MLLWAPISVMALFYDAALCDQLEACRAGQHAPAYDDPGRRHRVIEE